ncbi:3-methyl-2-oxobutanoate hydroxymethyltransferase [Nitrosophilus kaiyonis]|uniref:3-methyl-2-oxobutanoate hydroxymethyltransferase n=1 Tax=Nitrosophilus kaiyonis TaxID=2930200 RepID=UPI0024908CA2|nr:3-methyl-2-oxobutanoate hydroxymethyltransferase [Nitrosophilus kaiyonis]
MKKHTISTLKSIKGKEPIVMITAYDALFARLFEEYADIILVGDSLNMSFLGKSDTLSTTLDQMIYHTNAVCNGAKKSFVVCDMPYGTYIDKKEALKNAIKIYQETKADAVKIEGGVEKAETIKYLTQNGIAVMGHIGLLPQFVRAEGGYKIKGKNEAEIENLLKDAKAIEDAGAFCIVIEGVKSEAAKIVTKHVNIPVIGIGAGKDTDGQVLVWSDMLGFFEEFKPKFVKQYLNGAELVKEAIKKYADEVKNKEFPSEEYEY